MTAPSTRTVLQTLAETQLLELGRTIAVAVPPIVTKDALADGLAASGGVRSGELRGRTQSLETVAIG